MSLANEHFQSNLPCLFMLLPDATNILRFRVKKDLKRFHKNQEEHVQPLSENKHGICKSARSHNRELGFLRLLSLKMLGKSEPNIFSQMLVNKIMVMNPMGIESAKQIRNKKHIQGKD